MMQTHQSFVNMCSRLMLLSLLLVATAPMGRGGEASAQERETMSEAATPRVFFMSPKEGEEFRFFEFGVYESPVVFEFGVENYEIAAVPKEVGQVRSGIGHYHIGVDTECLSPGEVILGAVLGSISTMGRPGPRRFWRSPESSPSCCRWATTNTWPRQACARRSRSR